MPGGLLGRHKKFDKLFAGRVVFHRAWRHAQHVTRPLVTSETDDRGRKPEALSVANQR